MRPVLFSPKARDDLLEIADFIAVDSAVSAQRFVAKLHEKCQQIGRAPFGYVSRADLAPGLRMSALGRYVIFFRVLENTVRIERVVHGARDIPALFGTAAGGIPGEPAV